MEKVDIIELDEGREGKWFWEALDGECDYGSLIDGMGCFFVSNCF